MLISGGVSLLLLPRGRKLLPLVLAFIGILGTGVGLIFWTGLEQRFTDRWNVTSGDSITIGAGTRLANWKDALVTAQDFPLIGTGLGTFSFAYLPYQSWQTPVRFYNADNQFIEGLVEGGAIGFALLLLATGISLAVACMMSRSNPQNSAAIVGMTTIVGQAISACFDFGPTMAANMLLIAVVAGSVAGMAGTLDPSAVRNSLSRWLVLPQLEPAGLSAAISLMMLGYGLAALREVSAAADCRVAWRALPKRLDAPNIISVQALDVAIKQLTLTLVRRPDDADAHARLAHLLIYRYRQQTFAELVDLQQRGGPAPDWSLTDPIVLFHRTIDWKHQQDNARLTAIRTADVVRKNLLPAIQHLAAARESCPLMPGLDVLTGVLNTIVDPDSADIEFWLRRAIIVYPTDPALLDQCGILSHLAGRTQFAIECWKRSLELDLNQFPQIRHDIEMNAVRDVSLIELLPATPLALTTVAIRYFSTSADEQLRHRFAQEAQRLLTSSPTAARSSGGMRDQVQARIHQLLGEFDSADACYRQALAADPLNVACRLEFAGLLRADGRIEAALDQAEICRSEAPDEPSVRDFLKQLQKEMQHPSAPDRSR